MHHRGRRALGRMVAAFSASRVLLAVAPGRAAERGAYDATVVKAALLGKLCAFVRWPPSAGLDDPARPLEIVVFGQSPVGPMLTTIYRRARVAGHNVFVRGAATVAEIRRPHVLFVPAAAAESLAAVLAALGAAPVLIVGDGAGFAQRGVAINFVERDRKVRFEISRRALRRHGLAASYQLLQLATLVDEEPPAAGEGKR